MLLVNLATPDVPSPTTIVVPVANFYDSIVIPVALGIYLNIDLWVQAPPLHRALSF